MTQLRKRAFWSLGIFGSVMLLFLTIFFSGGGPEAFTDERTRRLAITGLFFAGYGAWAVVLYRTRARPGSTHVTTDERDSLIARRANSVALIAVMMFVFLLTIVLWTAYQKSGVVPAGWMYFVAYATAFFGFVSHACATLILDTKTVLRGEG